jgi:hypothetical protein
MGGMVDHHRLGFLYGHSTHKESLKGDGQPFHP